MDVGFLYKAFEDAAAQLDSKNLVKQMWFVDIDKFALCVLNWLPYNREISGPLTTSSFLGLLKYYTSQHYLRKINLNSFCPKIALLFFPKVTDRNFSDQLVSLDQSKILLPSMFDNC